MTGENKLYIFLKDPTWTKIWKIKYKALSYVIIDNELFKKTPK